MRRSALSRSALLIFAAVGSLLAAQGCNRGAAGSGTGASLSGPPVFNQQWQTRSARECARVTRVPNASQAAALVQCTMESQNSQGITLMQDVKVEMGDARAFIAGTDDYWESIDRSAKVYPLEGSQTLYQCAQVDDVIHTKGKNCTVSPWTTSEGRCWKTTFGDWKCNMTGSGGTPLYNQPGPTAY